MKNRLFRYIGREDHQPLTIHSYIRGRKMKIYKNLTFLSLSQLAIHVMYKTMMMLSEYEHDFLGIWSYASFNFARIFGFLLLPNFFLLHFGLKMIVRRGMLLYSLVVLILYVKLIGTVIPAASLMGLLFSTILVSQQFYICKLAKIMSKISGDDLEIILLRFSGIFYSFCRSYEIVCYLPISLVPLSHQTRNTSKDNCGRGFHFGNYDSLSEFTLPPSNESSNVARITVIFLAFCIVLLSTLLIDSLHKLTSTHLGFEDYSPGLARTFRLFKCRKLQVLIPMAIFAGFEKMMKLYDLMTAYVGCTVSSERSILVYFLGCLTSSQMSLAVSALVEVTSLQIILGLTASTYLISILILLLQNHMGLMGYYVLSAMWGLASSTWDCLLFVLYSMLSPGEELEAYSHLGFWYSLGAFVHLFMTNFVPVSFKLWTALVFLFLASVGILLLPSMLSCPPKKVGPAETESPTERTNDNSRHVRVDESIRRASMYFDKETNICYYNPSEVKSMTTSRVHHVAVAKTRSRFDRRESSNEEFF